MPETVTFDGCESVRKLSSGPVCDLYRAVQEPLGRTVLIKALGQNILPSSPFAATLEREARLLSELDHPAILKVYDFVKRGDRMWLVLEHVDGVTLEELLSKHTGQPLERVHNDTDRDFVMEANEALAYGIIDDVISSRDTVDRTGPIR